MNNFIVTVAASVAAILIAEIAKEKLKKAELL